MLNKIFDYELFSIGAFDLQIGELLTLLLLFAFASLCWRLTKAKWRLDLYHNNEVQPEDRRRFERYLRQLIILVTLFISIRILGLDFELFNSGGAEGGIVLRYSIVIIALIVLVLAWLTEWVFSNIIINKYEKDRKEEPTEGISESPKDVRAKITRLVQYIVIVLAAMAVIRNFGWDFEFWDYTVEKEEKSVSPNKILLIVLIFLMAQIISWIVTQVLLYGLFKRRGIDKGTRFAISQLVKYVIYTMAVIIALNTLEINMTLILGGAAALLVGIGLGLQQTFNDFFSGLVLLFERSVSVGDIMDVDGKVGAVKKIGLRSSIIETRANVSFIVPNSKLVNESIQNWSHFVDHGRFQVDVGVAYGSDTALVKRLLLEVANAHHLVLDYPTPFVRFQEFADSSLNFSVLFFTDRFMIIEDIKSDIRFAIDEAFRECNVNIPFPQRDVWMRGGGE